MAQEPQGQRHAAGVCWRVAGANELDALEGDPAVVAGAPEPACVSLKLYEGTIAKSVSIRTTKGQDTQVMEDL